MIMHLSRHRRFLDYSLGVILVGLAWLTILQGSGQKLVKVKISHRPQPMVRVVQSGPELVATVIPEAPVPAATPLPTPTPTPTPTAAPIAIVAAPEIVGTSYSGAQIVAIITAAAQADGVDPSWLINTAACESGYKPYAYNPAGPYDGLFQFLPATFRAHGGTDIWNPTQQANIAASMFSNGESSAWPVCSRK